MTTEVFYNSKMSVHTNNSTTSKPERFISALDEDFCIVDFQPIKQNDFYLAHEKQYVDGFFSGKGRHAICTGIDWSAEYAESVKYTTASLYQAIMNAMAYQKFTIAPVSGFHHATPKRGKMFCAMSGQVVASRMVYNQTMMRGAYIDLDSHFGNSIEDSKKFTNTEFITANINPKGKHRSYMANVAGGLLNTRMNKPDYLVYCHGADSIVGDPLGHEQCTEDEWFECTKLVAEFCKIDGIPLVYCLFGGYTDPGRVVDLHVHDVKLIKQIIES